MIGRSVRRRSKAIDIGRVELVMLEVKEDSFALIPPCLYSQYNGFPA